MNVFFVINGRRMKRYLLLAVACVFTIAVLYNEKNNLTVFSPQQPAAIFSVPTDKKVLALTFDISWGDTRAEPIIEVLKQKGVTEATFFLSAPWSESHPDIVAKIVDAGFEIGSHGHEHGNYSEFPDEKIRQQIQTAHAILNKVTGLHPSLIRLPNGDFDKRVLKIAEELNYTVIQWDTDSMDWMNIGTDKIIERVVTKAHPGDIVLMHASDSSKQTHEALPAIIDQLRSKGYSFVTVSELLAQTETKGSTVRDKEQATWLQPLVPTHF